MPCESYAIMIADSAVSVSTIHCRLLHRLARCDMTGCRVESRLISSWRRNFPPCWGSTWFNGTRSQREAMARLRGIKRNDRAGLLEAIQERFEQLAHGRKGIVIKQCSHPLPQQAFATQLRPHRLEQGAAQLLGLIHQKRQHHQDGKHHGEMLFAMTVVVLKVVALIFQGIERLIFNLPARPTTPHELIDVPLAYPQVCHPTKVLPLVLANLPILDEIDLYVRSRGIERHVVHKAKPMHHPGGAVVPLIIGDAPSFCGRLHLVEQIDMIPFFAPEDIVTSSVMQGFD